MRKKDVYKLQEAVMQAVIDDTGKVPDVKITILPDGKKKKIPEFVYVFQKVEFLLVQVLAPSSCKVLMYFRAVSEYHNRIDKDVSDIATWTNLSDSQVRRAILELMTYKILVKTKSNNDARRNIYYVNPQSHWKGLIEKAKELFPQFELNGMNNQLELELHHAIKNPPKISGLNQAEENNTVETNGTRIYYID